MATKKEYGLLDYLRDVLGRGVGAATVGGPVDIADLVSQYGIGDQTFQTLQGPRTQPAPRMLDDEGRPIGGSEWVGQKLQDYGVVSDQRNPVGEIIAGVVAPFSAKGLGAARKGLNATLNTPEMLQRMQAATSYIGVPDSFATVSNVVKPKGGQWLTGTTQGSLRGLRTSVVGEEPAQRIARIDEALALNPDVAANAPIRARLQAEKERMASAQSMNDWVNKQLTRYVEKEMGTPEDPVRALAERGVLHYEPGSAGGYARATRQRAGMSPDNTATTDLGKSWENQADANIHIDTAGDWASTVGNPSYDAVEKNPWLLKVPPNTPVYNAVSGSAEDLGFRHLVDELRNSINPDSGLPPELLLKYDSLPRVSVPDAVERVAKINAWREAQKVEANMKRANNAATHVVKEYPDSGFKWVELKKPQDTGKTVKSERSFLEEMGEDDDGAREMLDEYARDEGLEPGTQEYEAFMRDQLGDMKNDVSTYSEDEAVSLLRDALKYEGDTMKHCVGGYCDDVASGQTRIFSLRDAKGQPHTTIEVVPTPDHIYAGEKNNEIIKLAEERGIQRYLAPGNEKLWAEAEANLAARGITPKIKIQQIKGKSNQKPKAVYTPFVQDFVRTQGPWSEVRDIQNADLYDFEAVRKGAPTPGLYDWAKRNPDNDMSLDGYDARLKAAAPSDQRYMTADDLMKHLGYKTGKEGYAEGGSVRDPNMRDPFLPDFMNDPQFRDDIRENTRNVMGALSDPTFWGDVVDTSTDWLYDNAVRPTFEALSEVTGNETPGYAAGGAVAYDAGSVAARADTLAKELGL